MMNFPFFKQSELYDCGPTCLKMICAYYDKNHSTEYIKNISGLDDTGVTMYNLEQAALRLGFESFGVKNTIDQLFESILPCIIHWNARHFVVVPPQEFNGREILIANPAIGLVTVERNEFLKCWLGNSTDPGRGYVLQVFAKKKSKKKTFLSKPLKHFIAYLLPHRNRFLIVFALMLIGGLFTFLNPFISKNIIDKGITRKDIYFVVIMLVAQFFLFVGNTLIDLIRNWLLLHINNKFGIKILNDFLVKLTKLPVSYFDKKNVGDLQQRIYDHSRIQYFLTSNSITIVVSIITFLSLFTTLAYFNAGILLVMALFSALNVVWILYFLKRRKEIDYARFYNRGNNQDYINEIILGMQDIKLNHLEKYKIDKWYNSQEKQNELNIKMMKVDQTLGIGSMFLTQVESIAISFFSALAVIRGNMTLGMMMSIGLISGQLKGSINQFLYYLQSYQDASISLNRLTEIHDYQNEDEGTLGLTLQKEKIECIKLENVSFSFEVNGKSTLKNINLTIPKGTTTAIVGGSGSGKTTLLKLLLKYHNPTEGNILLNDETNLTQVSSKWWWQKCGAVMQESYIFSDTIENNIAISENEIDQEKLNVAKNIANISDFIESMPLKGKTLVGATGAGISGGQKQRLLIARAIYKNPDILLLDEATSALDSENEDIIMQNIDALFKGKTVIIIAHRLSTIKNADKIIVLENGEIIEEGTHKQLLVKNGRYTKLFSNQLLTDKISV